MALRYIWDYGGSAVANFFNFTYNFRTQFLTLLNLLLTFSFPVCQIFFSCKVNLSHDNFYIPNSVVVICILNKAHKSMLISLYLIKINLITYWSNMQKISYQRKITFDTKEWILKSSFKYSSFGRVIWCM